MSRWLRSRQLRTRRRDGGVATVEFALTFGVLFLVVALVWPIGEMLLQKMALNRAMSDVIRYATATPTSPAWRISTGVFMPRLRSTPVVRRR